MKKVLFLMFLLFLIVLGTVSVKAQVRIGGNGSPNAAAVLDLNANDDATPAANKGALALPRVSLASTTAHLNGATPITGMLVYNTNAALGTGVYYWDGTLWVQLDSKITAPSKVTLIRILDTTLTATIPPWPQGVAIPITRLTDRDFCVIASGGYALYSVSTTRALVVQNPGPTNQTMTFGARCYRDSVMSVIN